MQTHINVGIDGCYGIVVVTDTTNNISQMSEIVVIDNDTNVFLTEFGIIDSEGNTGVSGLGTIGANRLGTNTTQIVFTPNAGIDITLRHILITICK